MLIRRPTRARRSARQRPAGVASLLLVAAIAVVGAGVAGTAAQAVDIHGDDEADAYVGTGGLVLPGGVATSTRREVASCSGCRWRLTTPCLRSDLGHPFDGQSPCMSVVRGCPDGRRLLRAWFRPPDANWREIGLVCLGPAGPFTVQDLGEAAGERVVRGIPPLSLTFQPHRGVVTQLPVVFASGQPAGPQEWDVELLGQSVRLVASPTWSWAFGDGSSLTTQDPGGAYPRDTVAHAYRRSGGHHVTLTARWTADFTVAGLGTFPVPEAVVQEATAAVDVGEGRAVLAAP